MSVVLLKYCSLLFICKCCNLSVTVVNTNEEENLPTFLRERGRVRASAGASPLTPKGTLLAGLMESGEGVIIHTAVRRFAQPTHPHYIFSAA